MDKKELSEVGSEIVKKKPRGKSIAEVNEPNVEPGDNAKYLLVSMKLAGLPKVDLYDSDAVQERLDLYFQIQAEADMKPTVAGMGLALGIDRRRLWEIKTGNTHNNTMPNLPKATSDSVKRAYEIMENLWENYMQNGKINPVSGIFLGKNNFGYQDKTEYVVTPNVQQDNYDPDSIRQRYLIDSANDSDTEND